MKEIALNNNMVAMVDDEDFEYLNQFSWRGFQRNNTWYAERTDRSTPIRKTVYMHREIAGVAGSMKVDHKDRNGLNNTKENLRVCTNSQNCRNRVKSKSNTTGYKGVGKHYGKFSACIGLNNKNIHLGVFDTKEEAARAYDEAAKKFHGDFARLNFT
jgi:hypothetical protein